jgi:hypothetical protein
MSGLLDKAAGAIDRAFQGDLNRKVPLIVKLQVCFFKMTPYETLGSLSKSKCFI